MVRVVKSYKELFITTLSQIDSVIEKVKGKDVNYNTLSVDIVVGTTGKNTLNKMNESYLKNARIDYKLGVINGQQFQYKVIEYIIMSSTINNASEI